MSADCTDNCKDIALPFCPLPFSPLSVHSEVIDGSWACQLLDQCCIHCTALCLFSLPAGSLNRLEPLFCFSAGTLQPHTHSTTERQCDQATERLSNQTGDKKRAAANRARVYCRVLCTLFNLMRHLLGRGASTAHIKTRTTTQRSNCEMCVRHAVRPLTPCHPLPFYLACKLKSNTCCLIKRNTIYAIYSTIYISAMCAMCACKTSVDHGARFNEREKSCDSRL